MIFMKTNQEKKLVSWDDHLDRKYGKSGTPTRNKYEEGFEYFKRGVLVQEARMETSKFDIADYLDSNEMIAEYLNAVLAEGDDSDVITAIGYIANQLE
jgi:hypothetical protein